MMEEQVQMEGQGQYKTTHKTTHKTNSDGVIVTYDLPVRIEATHLKDIREAVERLASCIEADSAGDIVVAAGIVNDLIWSLQRYTKERWLKEKKKEANNAII